MVKCSLRGQESVGRECTSTFIFVIGDLKISTEVESLRMPCERMV